MKLLYFLLFNCAIAGSCLDGMSLLYIHKSALRSCGILQRGYAKNEQCIRIIDDVVVKADVLFSHVPGYKKVVKHLYASINESSKGAFYELQVALEFYNRGHKIGAFEKKYKNEKNGGICEFDIITDLCVIECKNINWHTAEKWPKVIPKMHKQIQDQQALIDSGVVGVSHYIFCSKNEIPPTECDWLRAQGVCYLVYSPQERIY